MARLFAACHVCGTKTSRRRDNKFICYDCRRRENESAEHLRKIASQELAPLRKIVFNRDGYKCCLCRSTKNIHADHIVPLSMGGKTEIRNLQTLCQACNTAKGNRSNKEFALRRFGARLLESTMERLSQ